MSDTTTGNSNRRCSFCGKTEEEAGGALVTLPPNTPVCPACLEREVNKMSQLFGFTMPGQGGQRQWRRQAHAHDDRRAG